MVSHVCNPSVCGGEERKPVDQVPLGSQSNQLMSSGFSGRPCIQKIKVEQNKRYLPLTSPTHMNRGMCACADTQRKREGKCILRADLGSQDRLTGKGSYCQAQWLELETPGTYTAEGETDFCKPSDLHKYNIAHMHLWDRHTCTRIHTQI